MYIPDYFLRKAIKLLRRRGYEVSKDRYSTAYLSRYGFRIATFVDVGVHDGTPVFYDLFRASKLVLIDPLPGIRERCHRWLSDPSLDIHLVETAAGAHTGDATFYLSGVTSSFFTSVGKQTGQWTTVPVSPLDDILKGLDGPFGIKIDTEGADLDVLRGATETLRKTTFVFTEVSIADRYEGSYSFAELIGFMSDRGFRVADFIRVKRNVFADVLFVRS